MSADKAEQAPSVTLGALPPAVTDLVTAIVEALDLPIPALDDADERAYMRVMERRVSDVRIILASMVDFPDVDISTDPAALRARIADTPVTYGLYEPATDGGEQR